MHIWVYSNKKVSLRWASLHSSRELILINHGRWCCNIPYWNWNQQQCQEWTACGICSDSAITNLSVQTKSVQVILKKFDQNWKLKSTVYETFRTCQHCNYIIRLKHKDHFRNRLLLRHNIISLDKIFECDLCGKILLYKHLLVNHVKKYSSERRKVYFCLKYAHGFKDKQSLVRHSQSKLYHKCPDCDLVFACIDLLRSNKKSVHGDVLKCRKCSYTTKKRSAIIAHRKTHSHPFTCESCGKNFAVKRGKRLHEMQHKHYHYEAKSGKTFKCDDCNTSYSSRSYLTIHKRHVHSWTKLPMRHLWEDA